MDKWVLWLGEVVWRIGKWPEGIRNNKSDEEFWFRLYGVFSLLMSMGAGMYVLKIRMEPLSELLIMLNNYTGADKILAQGYIGAGLILIIAAPILFAAAAVLATGVSIIPGIGLRLSKMAAWASLKWATTFKKKRDQAKELSPQDRERLMFLILGMLAVFIIWLAMQSSNNKPPGSSTDSPAQPDDNNAAPPAA